MAREVQGTMSLDPDAVAAADFSHGFRGYDVGEVRDFVRRVAVEMERLHARIDELASQPDPEQDTEAAADMRRSAEETVEKMLRDAQDEVNAVTVRASQERADLLEEAEREANATREAADEELERAREQGRAMVDEARQVRERTLKSLNDKRRETRRELAQLRAGIDDLRRSYAAVESFIGQGLEVLNRAMPSAREAALAAGEPREGGAPREPGARPVIGAPDTPRPQLYDQSADADPDPEAATSGELAKESTSEDGGAVAAASAPDGRAADSDTMDLDELDGSDATHEPAVLDKGVDDAAEGDLDAGESAEVAESSPVDEVANEDAVPDDDGPTAEGRGQAVDDAGVDEAGGEVIDLEERRLEMELDDDENDPALVTTDQIEARRQAHRRDAIESGELSEAALDEDVPLVPPRERGDIDELFARIRASRADAVAQAKEVLERTGELLAITPDAPAPLEIPGAAAASSLSLMEQRDAALHDLAPEAAIALKRALADQLNEVLDVLRRSDLESITVEELVPETGDRAYGTAIREIALQAAARGNPAGDVDLAPVIRAVSSEIGSTLRSRVAGYLGEPDRLEQRIRAVYREWRRERVDPVATDAIAAAFGLAVLDGLPHGTGVRWISPADGCSSPECLDNALATSVLAGEAFPTGDIVAPARPGCRCLVVPADQ